LTSRNHAINAFFDVMTGGDLVKHILCCDFGAEVARFTSFGDPLAQEKGLTFAVGAVKLA